MPIPIDPQVVQAVKQRLLRALPTSPSTAYNYNYMNIIPWQSAYVSGGAIASLIQGEEPKDYDVYFREEPMSDPLNNSLRNVLLAVYNDEIADVKEEYREYMGTDGKMVTENAITMKDGISLIFRSYDEPEYMKKTFDYLHCTPHYDIKTRTLHISPAAYWACTAKLLMVNNPDTVEQWRTDKFLKRGYRIPKD